MWTGLMSRLVDENDGAEDEVRGIVSYLIGY